ncbi:autotransporter outer membrane beta-barrel domain-containing protein [Neorhizobium petrolearium]|uniref:autotransporter family protein n=1 Tax=Neorhizobium petrolearium TaxID=515361 RepID=UPI003F17FE48
MKKTRRQNIRRKALLRLLSSAALVPPALTAILPMERAALAGSCTVGAISVCSGPSSGADVMADFYYNSPIHITTMPGFGLDVTSGDYGMSISGQGGVTFIDNHASTITTNGFFGVYVENNAGGDINFVSTGSIASTEVNGDGIRIYNYGEDTTVRVHDVTGQFNGINVNHDGTGSIYVGTTGMVTGSSFTGISVYGNSGTSLTIEAVDTYGVYQGIWGSNRTTGALTITSTGLAAGSDGDGIRADNYGTDVTVTAADTHGGYNGIIAQHYGTGALQVDSTGTATGDRSAGIYAYADTSSASATINAVDTKGGSSGINLQHFGTGPVTITSTGTAIGDTGNGVDARTSSGSSTLNVTVNNAQGGTHGIRTRHESAAGTPGNEATITVTGHIQGGTGYGISAESLAGILTNINVEAGSVVESASGKAIFSNDGDSNIAIADGAAVNGRIDLGLGTDTLTLRGGFSGITVLDGGGGGTDVLNISDVANATRVGSDIQNWTAINLDNSHLTLTGGSMTVGTAGDMTTGVFLRNGSILDGSRDNFSLFGNLSLAVGTRFLASDDGSGTTSISGNVINAGTISAAGGGAGDRIVIGGNYVGNNGIILLETELGGDASITDRLDIAGNTSGTSMVRVINTNGLGALTNEGIEVVTVAGVSDGVFTLLGDYEIGGVPVVVAGAYSYQLLKGNNSGTETDSWYLRSALINPPDPEPPDPDPLFHPGASAYEAYPQALLGLNQMPTLQQRVGNRFWLIDGDPVDGAAGGPPGAVAASGIWARIEGAHTTIDPYVSTAGTTFDQNVFRMQTGVDGALYESASGTLIGGLAAHYTHGETDTYSVHGDGKISTDGYGLGSTLTWYGDDGLYVDGQAQVAWYDSDLHSFTASRNLVRGNDAFGYALSLEGGKRIAFGDGWSMTPQAQMVYSHVDFERFVDVFGSSVKLGRGTSLQGRLAITLDRETTWKGDDGLTSRAHTYGIANLQYEFLDGTRVDVAGENFDLRKDRLWGGLGVGGSYSWNEDRYSLYGEGLIHTSLAQIGGSYSLQGRVGLRVKW